jgi:phosphate transport system protein
MPREALEHALHDLDTALLAAGESAVSLLERAIPLLDEPNDVVAHDVVAGATVAQGTNEDIEAAVERLMALQTPVARDLRFALGCAFVAYHIERIAANAGRIARLASTALPPPELRPQLLEMGSEACRAARAALAGFASTDAAHNIDLEAAVLGLQEDERAVVERIVAPGQHAGTALLAARYLTRVGEHALAIGRRTAEVEFGQATLDLEA